MKNLILIIHANLQQDLADLLCGLDSVTSFTLTHVEGHGEQLEHGLFYSARDKVVGYTPWVRAEILLNESDVDSVLQVLGRTPAFSGQGMYWITAVEQRGQL